MALNDILVTLTAGTRMLLPTEESRAAAPKDSFHDASAFDDDVLLYGTRYGEDYRYVPV